MPTDSTPPSFMPGLDFLKGLAAQAGKGFSGSLPGLGSLQQWVAPVLDPEELDKKIEELRTVHFWLEQNAKLLAATIQALEVQKMTLNTLRSMNVPFPDLKAAAKSAGPGPRPVPDRDATKSTAAPEAVKASKAGSASKKASTAAPEVAADAVKWWGALTEQFTQIASQALAQVSATADRAGTAGMAAAQSALDKASGAASASASAPTGKPGSPAARAGRSASGKASKVGSAASRTSPASKARTAGGRAAGAKGGRSDG